MGGTNTGSVGVVFPGVSEVGGVDIAEDLNIWISSLRERGFWV